MYGKLPHTLGQITRICFFIFSIALPLPQAILIVGVCSLWQKPLDPSESGDFRGFGA